MVNAILLHIVSNISDAEVDVGIIPEFRMESTRFEYAATSYGGVVDFLIVKGPPATISKLLNSDFTNTYLLMSSLAAEFLLVGPQLAFTNPHMVEHVSSNIYEAKRGDGLRDAVPQATMASASYCRQHK